MKKGNGQKLKFLPSGLLLHKKLQFGINLIILMSLRSISFLQLQLVGIIVFVSLACGFNAAYHLIFIIFAQEREEWVLCLCYEIELGKFSEGSISEKGYSVLFYNAYAPLLSVLYVVFQGYQCLGLLIIL